MSYLPWALRSTTLRSSFSLLDEYLINNELPDELGEDLLLNEVQKHYDWLTCIEFESTSTAKSSNRKNKFKNGNFSDNISRRSRSASVSNSTFPNLDTTIEDNKIITKNKRKLTIDDSDDDEDEEDVDDGSLSDYKPSVKSTLSFKRIHTMKKEKTESSLLLELNKFFNNDDIKYCKDESYVSSTNDNDAFYINCDLKNLIHNDNSTIVKPDDISNYKYKKIWVMSGLKSASELSSSKFQMPDISHKPFLDGYKLPFNIFTQEILENFVDVNDVAPKFNLVINNNFEGKLPKVLTVRGYTLGNSAKAAKKYEAYRKNLRTTFVKYGTEIFKTYGKGYGLRSNREFSAKQIVTEYTGDILTYSEFFELPELEKEYCIGFVDGYVISTFKNGSKARFINHSHSSNAYLDIFLDDKDKPKICVFAGKHGITTGEEVTINYNRNTIYNMKPNRCFCKSPICSGYIRFFQKKLVLINLKVLNDSSDARKLMLNTIKTDYPSFKLKKLSKFDARPNTQLYPDFEENDYYFFVLGRDQEYYENNVVISRDEIEFYQQEIEIDVIHHPYGPKLRYNEAMTSMIYHTPESDRVKLNLGIPDSLENYADMSSLVPVGYSSRPSQTNFHHNHNQTHNHTHSINHNHNNNHNNNHNHNHNHNHSHSHNHNNMSSSNHNGIKGAGTTVAASMNYSATTTIQKNSTRTNHEDKKEIEDPEDLTNGSAAFSALPSKLKKQLNIDMVVRNL